MGPELSASEENRETEIICADCEDNLDYGAEVVLVQIVQPKLAGGEMLFYPVIDEHAVNGDFLFEPFVYCFGCWDNRYWDLKNEVDDTPPVLDSRSVLDCTCCGSGIREWEYAATFTVGELQSSPREPSNRPGPTFNATGKPEVICLYCMTVLNENHITMWDELSQAGECADCTHIRCWRHGSCGCGCHTEETEET